MLATFVIDLDLPWGHFRYEYPDWFIALWFVALVVLVAIRLARD